MTSPLAGGLAKQAAAALKPLLLPATYTYIEPGAYDPDTGTSTETLTDYPCRGFLETYSTYTQAARFLAPTVRKVIVLAQTLAVTPSLNDRVTVQGETFTVKRIDSDPARATWELEGHLS